MTDSLEETPRGAEGERKQEVERVKKVGEAIDRVRYHGAIGVYQDSYMDPIQPHYIVFYDTDRFEKFEALLQQTKNLPEDTPERNKIFDELDTLADTDIETNSIYWIYRNEKWAIPPDVLLSDAEEIRIMEEDFGWYEAQREHFAGIEED